MVLNQGSVVETGTHSELMSANGLYRRLVERQFSDRPPLSEMGRVEATAQESATTSTPESTQNRDHS